MADTVTIDDLIRITKEELAFISDIFHSISFPEKDAYLVQQKLYYQSILTMLKDIKRDKMVLMPSALTAENGAKSLLIGKFSESIQSTCPECGGDGYSCDECYGTGEVIQWVPVTWTTTKAIYKKAVEHFGKA